MAPDRNGANPGQREIDGFFYNQFLNGPLQAAIREARRQTLGHEGPPYPCDWSSPNAGALFVEPWGHNGSLHLLTEPITLQDIKERSHEYLFPPDGPPPQVAHWELHSDVQELHERFFLREDYLQCTMVHGTPVPFKRLDAFFGHSRWRTAWFTVIIYSLPIGQRDLNWINSRYEPFNKCLRLTERLGIASPIEVQVGANVQTKFHELSPRRLEILFQAPYASPKVLRDIVTEAVNKYKIDLPGSRSGRHTVRAWTVYLLAQSSETNRLAINLWNETLGNREGLRYHLDNESFESPSCFQNARVGAVTSSGESQFSRDKRDLEKRISHYQEQLIRQTPRPQS